MGYGSWSDRDYRKSARGSDAFKYSDDTRRKPREQWKIHQLLNPSGLVIRESRDSAEHPQSNAVMIGLDVTGSMARVVVEIRDALGNLMDMLLTDTFVVDPQLLFYAVGDATCDNVPFQVSQFESDIKINDQLTKVILEQGGGGQQTESYELGFYVASRHTSIDCLEKRGRKGYLVTIGDEMPYPAVDKDEVKEVFRANLQDSIPLSVIVTEAQQKYHTLHIIPKGSQNFADVGIRNYWAGILGGRQFVIMLEEPKYTAETIAVAIGLNEGRVTFEEGLRKVQEKSGQEAVEVVRKALADFAAYAETLPKDRAAADAGGMPAAKGKKDKKDKKDWRL